MQHFSYLGASASGNLFERAPEPFGRGCGVELLSVALGATLYMPATRPALAADIVKQAGAGVTSVVACCEDAIADEQVPYAETNVVGALQALHDLDPDVRPLVFVRVREPGHITSLTRRLGTAVHSLTGFVLPKFTAAAGPAYFAALEETDRAAATALLAMPVLESGAVLYAESRIAELTRLHALLNRHRDRILAVRLGATDMCALYGLRRSRELSIYDVRVVADLIADVVNVLGRVDGTGFTVSGPVWEYYGGSERLFKPQLRLSPFDEHNAPDLRQHLVSRDIDGLIREVELDRANGLTGKTAIHPSHVAVVHALSVVPYEEYRDARDILDAGRAGGVLASGYGNKMNEIRPHSAWAHRTLLHSQVFGVAADGVSFVDLLGASLP